MKLLIVAVGQRVPDWAQTAWDDYAKRFPSELKVELKAVKTEPRGSKTLQTLYTAERLRIEAAIPRGTRIVALDERGTALTTQALAARLKDWQLGGDDVALVIQLDPPLEYKTYLHRSGRTGRGGKTGTVVTLIPRQRRRRIEDLLHRAERDGIFTDVWPGHEILEKLAGEIAPPPAIDVLDFGGRGRDGRENGGGGGGRGRSGGGRDRGPRGGDRDRGGRGSNYGGNGKGRWADRGDNPRPRDKHKVEG